MGLILNDVVRQEVLICAHANITDAIPRSVIHPPHISAAVRTHATSAYDANSGFCVNLTLCQILYKCLCVDYIIICFLLFLADNFIQINSNTLQYQWKCQL